MPFLIPPLSFLLCPVATPAVRLIAVKKGWVAHPSAERWHNKPTALFGGIAIYLGMGTAIFLTVLFWDSVPVAALVAMAVAGSPAAFMIFDFNLASIFTYKLVDFSKGIFVIDQLLTNTYLFATRGSFKFFLATVKRKSLGGAKTLIYGAGRGDELLLRELLNNEGLRIQPIGFIDDDTLKTGRRLQEVQGSGFSPTKTFTKLPKGVQMTGDKENISKMGEAIVLLPKERSWSPHFESLNHFASVS